MLPRLVLLAQPQLLLRLRVTLRHGQLVLGLASGHLQFLLPTHIVDLDREGVHPRHQRRLVVGGLGCQDRALHLLGAHLLEELPLLRLHAAAGLRELLLQLTHLLAQPTGCRQGVLPLPLRCFRCAAKLAHLRLQGAGSRGLRGLGAVRRVELRCEDGELRVPLLHERGVRGHEAPLRLQLLKATPQTLLALSELRMRRRLRRSDPALCGRRISLRLLVGSGHGGLDRRVRRCDLLGVSGAGGPPYLVAALPLLRLVQQGLLGDAQLRRQLGRSLLRGRALQLELPDLADPPRQGGVALCSLPAEVRRMGLRLSGQVGPLSLLDLHERSFCGGPPRFFGAQLLLPLHVRIGLRLLELRLHALQATDEKVVLRRDLRALDDFVA
mmetsp:Transcript_123344/g.356474  ORF Transcript_123344/g.356474 Transcript_123344/m.356474 type:complete len:383 (+) Transcript_123344:403-1551(+)